MPPSGFSIAQITPYGWEEDRETNRYVHQLSRALAARGHDVVIVAPSLSRKLVAQSRALIKSAAGDPSVLFKDSAGMPKVLGIGQSLPFPPAKLGGTVTLPIDVARTLEELFELDAFDFVHVHEPFAPSASSAALRMSRTLNIGTFHQATDRTLSTQVARRFVELFFGRLDARTANNAATRDLVKSYFGGNYEILGPGAERAIARSPRDAEAPIEIFLSNSEERAAQRILLRALRKLPRELRWHATIRSPAEQPVIPASLSKRMRERVRFVGRHDGTTGDYLAAADIAVAASAGTAPSPGYVARIVASGAVPLAAGLPAYREALDDGELGLMFESGHADALAEQLARLIDDAALRERLQGA
ncbi:MAG: glycosyltransferase family 4 protein, partial [Solirubrobacterales bacterium]